MNSTKQISPWQFATFRMLFGLYLTVHFIQLLPYANELFGSAGVLGNARLNPLHGLFPNPLASVTWPQFPVVFVSILALEKAIEKAFSFSKWKAQGRVCTQNHRPCFEFSPVWAASGASSRHLRLFLEAQETGYTIR